VLHPNYKLKLQQKIILDPFDPSFQNTYIQVKNEHSGSFYSMRIIPFRGYNSYQFKKGL